MPNLTCCSTCSGFVPAHADACPNCDSVVASPASARSQSRWSRLGRRLMQVAGGGAVAVTLMACYGASPHLRANAMDRNQCVQGIDADGDGHCTPEDCDDNNRAIRPGASDRPGDGIDQNCDGTDGMAVQEPGMVAPTRPLAPVK